jgi:hypothetical protein
MLAGIAASVWRAVAQQEQPVPSRHRNGPKPRRTPAICLYSGQLLKAGYEELAGMIHMRGFDGVELMVQPGGHIGPQLADLHLERGIEAMTGSGVDVYAIGTPFTSPADATVRLALGWGGEMGVPVFRPGHWKFNDSETGARLIEVQREIATLATMGRKTGISPAIHNGTADCVGSSVWDLYFILGGMDRRAVGYDFDIGYAAGQGGESGWQTFNEHHSLQFRAEAFISTNRPNWGMPGLNILSGAAFPGQPATAAHQNFGVGRQHVDLDAADAVRVEVHVLTGVPS